MDKTELIKYWKKKIRPKDKIVIADKDITTVTSATYQETGMKPKGLWYGIGAGWLEFCENEMPGRIGNVAYRIEVSSGVLKLPTTQAMYKFHDQFTNPRGGNLARDYIDWKAVASKYAGIEIAPYQRDARWSIPWYYTWDVASGCIWKKSAISKIEKL